MVLDEDDAEVGKYDEVDSGRSEYPSALRGWSNGEVAGYEDGRSSLGEGRIRMSRGKRLLSEGNCCLGALFAPPPPSCWETGDLRAWPSSDPLVLMSSKGVEKGSRS